MAPRAADRRDPGIAAVLSALLPGAGLLYARASRAAAVILVTEIALFALGWWLVLLPLHLWQVAAAAGTAATCGARGRDVFETRRAANPIEAA